MKDVSLAILRKMWYIHYTKYCFERTHHRSMQSRRWCQLNLSGRGPSILLRKSVLSLKCPTGAFIAALRSANANFALQNTCWEHPNPICSASCRCRLRVCSKHFYNKKDSLGLFHEGRVLGYLRLSGLRFFCAALFFSKEQFYVSLCTKKLLHFFFRFAVVRVECFLFCQQLGIFCIPALPGRCR